MPKKAYDHQQEWRQHEETLGANKWINLYISLVIKNKFNFSGQQFLLLWVSDFQSAKFEKWNSQITNSEAQDWNQ